MIKIINLLLLLFERIVIRKVRLTAAIFCFNYNSIIFKDDFIKLLDKLEYVSIEPTIDLEKISNKFYERSLFKLEIVDTIINNDLKRYFEIVDKIHLNNYINIQYAKYNNPINFQVEDDIKNSLNKNHLNIKNNYIDCIINPIEGNEIYNLIIKNKLHKCIEIGMDYGIISTYILLGLEKLNKDVKLISIDEYQKTRWNDIGLKIIELNDFTKNHQFYNEPAYLLLPKLLDNKYDLIFISGWNTFDYIMISITFALIILKDDGFVVINNKYNNRVNKCIRYIDSNYKNFIKIETDNTLIIYKKVTNDIREINYFNEF
jgi:predicted O-methyltransferase YrrM